AAAAFFELLSAPEGAWVIAGGGTNRTFGNSPCVFRLILRFDHLRRRRRSSRRLLVSQGHHGIYLCCPPRGEVAASSPTAVKIPDTEMNVTGSVGLTS